MNRFRVKESDAGKRADVFVASKYPTFTRSSLELLFYKRLVKLDSEPIKASYKVKAGDKIEVDETYLNAAPPPIKLPVIHEDQDVIVLDKPAGILTHAKGALNLEGSVASFIKPRLKNIDSTTNRAGIVHRLDRATSGVIITAKSQDAHSKLQRQFSRRKVKKNYLAIVEGKPESAEAIIDAPLLRNPAKPQTFKVNAGGKKATTHYLILKTFSKRGKVYSLVELRPQTGRTHQLRVHMAYIKHPIVGDHVYGRDNMLGMMLHAQSLELTLPSGERKIFTSPMPKRFKEFMDA